VEPGAVRGDEEYYLLKIFGVLRIHENLFLHLIAKERELEKKLSLLDLNFNNSIIFNRINFNI